jgi:hypothetical protein
MFPGVLRTRFTCIFITVEVSVTAANPAEIGRDGVQEIEQSFQFKLWVLLLDKVRDYLLAS